MRACSRLALVLAVALLCAAFASEAFAAPGSIVWKKAANPSAGSNDLSLSAPGPGGGVYAAGMEGAYPDVDIWVVRYRANGTQAWSKTWNGPDSGYDQALGIAVDKTGDVYVCGRTRRASANLDSVLLKYDPAGTLAWAKVYPFAAGSDEADAVGLDAAGNVYIAGTEAPTPMRAYTGKVSPGDGVLLWATRYQGPGMVTVDDIAVTRAGDCYVAGRAETGTNSGTYDAILFRSVAAGVASWTKSWNGPKGGHDEWTDVEPAPNGRVAVSGATHENGAADLACARYASSGKRLWARTWSSAGSWTDRCRGLAVARDGSAWVAGLTSLQEGVWHGALVKWTSSGRRLFSRTLGTAKTAADFEAVAVDTGGNAYVAGTVGSGAWDLLALKYSPAGRLLWRTTAGFGSGSMDTLESICLGPPGYLYATGQADTAVNDTRGVVVKIRR